MSRKIIENKKTGFVLVFRSLRKNWKWGKKPYSNLQAFLDLIMEAEFEDCEIEVGNDIILIKRGQVYRSLRDWATRWGWHRSRVDRYLRKMEFDSTILRKNVKKQDMITIVKYDDYQFGRDVPETMLRQCWDNAETPHQLFEKELKEDKRDIIKDIQYINNNIYITQLKSLISEWNFDKETTDEFFSLIKDEEIAVLYLEKAKSINDIIRSRNDIKNPARFFYACIKNFQPKIDKRSRKFARKIIKENENRQRILNNVNQEAAEREKLKKDDPEKFFEFLNGTTSWVEFKKQIKDTL